MAIRVQCNHCQAKFKTDACHAGKSTRCPHCRRPLTVPALDLAPRARIPDPVAANTQEPPNGAQVHKHSQPATANSSPVAQNGKPDKKSVAKQLRDGFAGPIKKNRATLRYRLSTVVVAVVMLLLPLIYVALIVLAGYGVYYHAVNHVGMLEIYRTSIGFLFMLLAYSLPLFCGIVLILFMLKPLLVKQAEQTRTRSLKRDKEPLLFEFIDSICESIGAPHPTRIDLDCQLNASASYGRGFFASLVGKDLVLTIGLPLVAGLNTRQLAGVLAHEFGHFAQGAGMRLTYFIRSISHWLLRVVYERDAADQWLSQATESLDTHIAWIPYLASVFVWLTRRILWVLMMIGQLFGSYLLRQMEFDADRYEARLAGSETFMQTAIGLQILGIAAHEVYADLEQNIRDEHLIDDLPELILLTAEQLPEEVQESVIRSIEDTPTHWFDTHPADRDRIARALQEETEGVFQIELPSTVLFNDFASQSKATTWEYYREQFGDRIQRSQLVPVEKILAKQNLREASQTALNRFFQGNLAVTLPFPLRYKHSQSPKNAQQTLEELKSSRQQMFDEMATAASAFRSLHQYQAQLALAVKLRYCCRAGLEVDIESLFNSNDGEQEANRLEATSKKGILNATNTLETYQDLATKRLGSALQLLHTAQVAKRIPNSEQAKQRCQQLLQCYTALSDQMPTLIPIMHLHGVLGLLIERLPNDDDADSYFIAIQGITRQLTPAIQLLRNAWSRCPYPYGSPENQQSLGKYLIPDPPIGDQASTIFSGCDQAVTAAFPLYLRLLGDLTLIAAAVENSLRLEPLPEFSSQPDAIPETITEA